MKTIKIELSHPKVPGMEVKSVAADIEKGYSVVEYGVIDEFKRGDICKLGSNEIHIFGSRRQGCDYNRKYFDRIVTYIIDADRLFFDVDAFGYFGDLHRLATPSEQQLLFDALAKEGKKWNSETLEIEDIEKDILVPESIGIYRYKYNDYFGDKLFIGFNDESQFLGVRSDLNRWITYAYKESLERIPCKLIPCKREDLKAGETVGIMQRNLSLADTSTELSFYNKVISGCEFACIDGKGIEVYNERVSPTLDQHVFYKVVPK